MISKAYLSRMIILLTINALYPLQGLAMYKCQAETTIRYSDVPCTNQEKSLSYTASSVIPDKGNSTDVGNHVEREKALLKTMERDRLKYEKDASISRKQNVRQGAITEKHQLQCAKLRTQLEQAEVSLRYSKPHSIEANQQRVERAREKLQFEAC